MRNKVFYMLDGELVSRKVFDSARVTGVGGCSLPLGYLKGEYVDTKSVSACPPITFGCPIKGGVATIGDAVYKQMASRVASFSVEGGRLLTP